MLNLISDALKKRNGAAHRQMQEKETKWKDNEP